MEQFQNRICFKGDIREISKNICRNFNLGNFKENKVIPFGYEDFNYSLLTTNGKYFVKIFADTRTLDDCKRNVIILEKALEASIMLPKLFTSNQGTFHLLEIDDAKLRLIVMDYINGYDLLRAREKPSQKDIAFLAHQAALINSIPLKPHHIYDQWATVNLVAEYKKKRQHLSPNDKKMIEPLVKKFQNINSGELPHTLVHGDIIKTNVIKDDKDKLWLLDFSVANYYPRIVELAVLACDICFTAESREKTEKKALLKSSAI